MTLLARAEAAKPEPACPDHPGETAHNCRCCAAEATQGHRYDPKTGRCTCGALDHPDWGVPA